MGYTIIIGEYKCEIRHEGTEGEYKRITAELVSLPNAPAYGSPTDYLNERYSSYSAWSGFNEFVGLPLSLTIPEHPGWRPITVEIQNAINLAHSKFKNKYPQAIAKMTEDGSNPEYNYQLARLEWLKFWVDWSLLNCKSPIICNS